MLFYLLHQQSFIYVFTTLVCCTLIKFTAGILLNKAGSNFFFCLNKNVVLENHLVWSLHKQPLELIYHLQFTHILNLWCLFQQIQQTVILAKYSKVNIFILCGDGYKVTQVVTSVNLVQNNFYGMFQKPHDQDFLFRNFLKHNQQKFFLLIRLLDHIYVIFLIYFINLNQISLQPEGQLNSCQPRLSL